MLETSLRVVAGGVLLLLLSTACDTASVDGDSTVECNIKALTLNASDQDGDAVDLQLEAGGGVAARCRGEVQPLDPRLGGGVELDIELSGGDTSADLTTEQTLCYEVTETDERDVFEAGRIQFETGCDDEEGEIRLLFQAMAQRFIAESGDGTAPQQRAAEAPIVLLDGEASVACGATQVTSTGFPTFATNIPGFRYGVSLTRQRSQFLSLEQGDRLEMTFKTSVTANLAPGASSFSSLAVSGNYEGMLDFGITRVPCSAECSDDPNCPIDEFCEANRCLTRRFASDPLNFTLTTNPSPVVAGQPFVLGFTVDAHEDELQLLSAQIVIPRAALEYTGIAATNQGVAGCNVGGLGRPVLTTLDANQVYLDTDGSASFDPNDPTITFTEDATNLTATLFLANGGDRSTTGDTVPTDVTVSCTGFFGLFTATTPGTYPVTVTLTSVDTTTGGAGPKSLTRTFNSTFDNITFQLDRDGDGTPDDQDGCPDDPQKTSPGLCGCGVDDASDGADCDTDQSGRCKPGTRVCSAGDSQCVPKQEPTDETCNDVDDDCDGQVDEELLEGLPCIVPGQLGVCADGVTTCLDTFVCLRARDPSPEIPCNGLDEDCNGVVDDGCQKLPLTSLSSTATLDATPKKDKITGKGVFDWTGVFDPETEGMTVRIRQGVPTLVQSETVLAPGAGWKTKIDKKGNAKWTFKDAKDGALGDPDSKDAATVTCKIKKQVCTVKVTIQSLDLPALQAGETTIEIGVGNDLVSDTRVWASKSKGKKLVAAKDP